MSIYNTLIIKIIHEQETIIGPIAWLEARKVSGLTVQDEKSGQLTIEGDGKHVLEGLVLQYDHLFGRASREVCKSAIVDLLPTVSKEDLPQVLL